MTPENIDRNEIIEQELKAYLDGAYAKYSDAKSQLEAFAKLVEAAAASKERQQIIAITETQEFSRMYGEFTPSAHDLVKAIRARGNKE